MTNQNNNPFVLPGLGQSGELAQNPLLASMEMMRQAWQGMAGSGSLAQSSLTTPMSLEDLERRIADLRTVENWLRMNLTMLSSTIQGLEVQRATIATLKSFIATPPSDTDPGSGGSPLEVALGIKPSGQARIRHADAAAQASTATGSAGASTPDALAATAGWWTLLQKQFDTLASATAATMQGAEAMQAAAVEAAASPAPAPAKPAAKTAVKSSASKAAAKTASKAAPRKRAASAPKKTRSSQ